MLYNHCHSSNSFYLFYFLLYLCFQFMFYNKLHLNFFIWKINNMKTKKKKNALSPYIAIYIYIYIYIYISFVIFIYSRGFWLLLFLLSFLPIDVRKTTLIFFIFPFSLKKLIMFLCIVFLIYLYYKKKNPFTLFFFILAFYLFHFQETWQYLWQTKGGENKRAKHLLHDDVITKQYDLTTFLFYI